jgi:hypothetical protein
MTHRATILTRIYTEPGIVGEAFVGDEEHINDQIGARDFAMRSLRLIAKYRIRYDYS